MRQRGGVLLGGAKSGRSSLDVDRSSFGCSIHHSCGQGRIQDFEKVGAGAK